MALRLGDTNKKVIVNAGFDMSSYTELTLDFELPDGTTSVQKLTADGVTIGAGETLDGVTYTANFYVTYQTEVGFLSQAGTWAVKLTYTNTATTPDTIYVGDCVQFTVDGATCSVS